MLRAPYLRRIISLRHAKQTHAAAVRCGHIHHPLHWNAILAAYSRELCFTETLTLFNSMLAKALPDNYTLAIAAKASGEVRVHWMGVKVHSLVEKLGFCVDAVVGNCLTRMYFRCENYGDGRRVFDEMPVRNLASWNGLMAECLGKEDVWRLFRRMQQEGLRPDGITVSIVLPLCGNLASIMRGREIHGFSIRNGFYSDFHVGSCLIDMYSKCKNIDLGRQVFDQMAFKNVVVWTSMVNGYVQNGDFEESLHLFRKIQLDDGISPNRVTLLCVLSTVGSLASIVHGKEIHGFSIKTRLYGEVALNNALIDMYFKCGSLDMARRIFGDGSWEKDAISWGSMACGYGLHGKGDEAIALFQEMCRCRIEFDHTTCIGIVSACGKSGLIDEGFEIYNSLIKDHHQTSQTNEIHSCVVNMFCRAGQLDRALDFIKSISLESNPSVWGSVFGYAVIHGNLGIRDLAYHFLLKLEPENPCNDVALSNSLASFGKWDAVVELRRRMKERGLQKTTGCSWIFVNTILNSFFVADKYHENSERIYEILHDLMAVMREAGCVPDS